MIDIAWKNLYYEDSVDKQLKISFEGGEIGNRDIDAESMELTESLCSQQQLRFGCCEASVFKIRVRNHVAPLSGREITVTQSLQGDTEKVLQIGKYKVISDVPDGKRNYRDITAYDALYDILSANVAAWYKNLTFPLSLRQFRDSLLQHFGIEQETAELPNDGMMVEKTIEPEELSGKDVLTAVCELNGCFGHLGREGKFQYIFLETDIGGLYPSNTLYPAEDLLPMDTKAERIGKSKYIDCKYEDYLTPGIDKLQIRKEENDVGCIIGSGKNCYVIEDNFLVYGKGEAELTDIGNALYAVISEIPHYRPYECTAAGNPCIEVGDAVSIPARYEIVESYVFRRTLKGIQALRDSYGAEGTAEVTENVNSVRKSIVQLKGKTNILTRTLEETKLTIGDLEKNLQTQITVNANGIQTKVSKNSVVSEINQSAETITIQAAKIDLQGLVTATEFTSKYATITSLNAQKARIDNIEANYISAGTVAANYATIGSLNAANAVISGKLEASQFTAENISAMNITVKSANVTGGFSASKITSGTISADRLDASSIVAKLGQFSGQVKVMDLLAQDAVVCKRIAMGGLSITASEKWRSITVDGTTYSVLCRG